MEIAAYLAPRSTVLAMSSFSKQASPKYEPRLKYLKLDSVRMTLAQKMGSA